MIGGKAECKRHVMALKNRVRFGEDPWVMDFGSLVRSQRAGNVNGNLLGFGPLAIG